MNVWKVLKPYLPDFLYIKLQRDQIIKIVKEVIKKLRDSEIPSNYLDPNFHGNYYTLKLARVDKIYPLIYGKTIDLEEIAKNPKRFPEVLEITRSLYDYLKGKSLEEIIKEKGWDKRVMKIFEKTRRNFGRYFKLSEEFKKIEVNFDEVMEKFEKNKWKGVKSYLRNILGKNWEKTYNHFKYRLRSWYSTWIRLENLRSFRYGKEIFWLNWKRMLLYIMRKLKVSFRDIIKLGTIIEGKKENMWHTYISVFSFLENILSEKNYYVGMRCNYLKRFEEIIGDIFLDEIILYRNISWEILLNDRNLDDFWNLLGFVYKKLNVYAGRKNVGGPLKFASINIFKILYLKSLLERFGLNLPIYENKHSKFDRVYSINLPGILTYITKNFVKKSADKDAIKRFLSELITKNEKGDRYFIVISKKRYLHYGSIDRLLSIVGLSYHKFFSKSYQKQYNKYRNYVIYNIHPKSRSLAEEIYNMSIFREVRRRT